MAKKPSSGGKARSEISGRYVEKSYPKAHLKETAVKRDKLKDAISGRFVEGPRTTPRGSHVWRVGSGDNFTTVTTSGSSIKSLDRTVDRHSKTLKKLAKR